MWPKFTVREMPDPQPQLKSHNFDEAGDSPMILSPWFTQKIWDSRATRCRDEVEDDHKTET